MSLRPSAFTQASRHTDSRPDPDLNALPREGRWLTVHGDNKTRGDQILIQTNRQIIITCQKPCSGETKRKEQTDRLMQAHS